jgi:hypothetical protein
MILLIDGHRVDCPIRPYYLPFTIGKTVYTSTGIPVSP